MSSAAETVHAVEELGGTLWLVGDEVKVRYPKDRSGDFAPLLKSLRELRSAVSELLRARQSAQPQVRWPQQSLHCEQMFRHPSTRLYPFIGKLVVTPRGTGELLQVFNTRVAVLLDSELSKPTEERRMAFFSPSEIYPRQ